MGESNCYSLLGVTRRTEREWNFLIILFNVFLMPGLCPIKNDPQNLQRPETPWGSPPYQYRLHPAHFPRARSLWLEAIILQTALQNPAPLPLVRDPAGEKKSILMSRWQSLSQGRYKQGSEALKHFNTCPLYPTLNKQNCLRRLRLRFPAIQRGMSVK